MTKASFFKKAKTTHEWVETSQLQKINIMIGDDEQDIEEELINRYKDELTQLLKHHKKAEEKHRLGILRISKEHDENIYVNLILASLGKWHLMRVSYGDGQFRLLHNRKDDSTDIRADSIKELAQKLIQHQTK